MLNEATGPTSRAERKDERRSQLLRAALAEFVEKGYHGASTRTITAAAGISPGLLFHYFPSKEALYAELVRRGMDAIRLDLDTDDPIGTLTAAAAHAMSLAQQGSDAATVFTFMHDAERHPGISEEVDRMFNEHDLIASSIPTIEAGQAQGTIRAGDPLTLAVTFWGALIGIATELTRRPALTPPDADWLVDMLRAGEDR